MITPYNGDTQIPSEMISVLQHDRRWKIVNYLHNHDEELSLVRLANRISTVSAEPLPDVFVQLHDYDLPKLTECGLVEYDSDTGTVTITEDPAVVESVLERTDPR